MWARRGIWLTMLVVWASQSYAQTASDTPTNDTPIPVRPNINFYRWLEDWSVLADPRVPREFGDSLKYISLSNNHPKRYLSFGITLRERFESEDPPFFGAVGGKRQNYLLHRLEAHVDAHITDSARLFIQIENALAPGLQSPSPVDVNKLDLRLAFLDWHRQLGQGEFKVRAGRQEIDFDLQRFVSVRDGPNVRQAYDAIWVDYETERWRFTGFASQPVQYSNQSDWADYSNRHLVFGGVRAERRMTDHSQLSASFSDFRQDNVTFLAALGNEERQSFDVHYFGNVHVFDLDVEGMKQGGSIGSKNVDAWAFGSLAGFTLIDAAWTPRFGAQLDAASGTHNLNSNTIGTFNPLFPNGYYETLSGYTGFTNFIHFKPSITVVPFDKVKLVAAFGMLWRQTTQDAIYVQPDFPVPGTAGEPGRRSSNYAQIQINWIATHSLAFSLETDRYFVASAIRNAGGHDSDYLGVQMSWGW